MKPKVSSGMASYSDVAEVMPVFLCRDAEGGDASGGLCSRPAPQGRMSCGAYPYDCL